MDKKMYKQVGGRNARTSGGMISVSMDANGGGKIDCNEIGACRKKCSDKAQAL